MTEPAPLVVPSNIPWSNLTAESLEQLVFWLLDALGAKDLQWRVGATTHHASDGGRDLEATFHQATPDGELRAERWWVQCKGRSSSVGRRVAQDAVADAEGVGDVDVVVVATNARFTNPTWDWVRGRAEHHRRPVVRLWDRERLERLLVQHPDVVARSAPEALSLQGRLAALCSQFWNQMYFPGRDSLEELWVARDELNWDEQAFVALVAGELVNGDLNARPWAAWAPTDLLEISTTACLANAGYLALRCSRFGIDTNKIIRLAAHLCLASLARCELDEVESKLSDPWQFTESDVDAPTRKAMRDLLLSPVLQQLNGEIADVCTRDCRRVSTDVTAVPEEEADETYWDRLILLPSRPPAERDDRQLVVQMTREPCVIDVAPNDTGCPLFEDDLPLREELEALRAVVLARVEQRRASR